MDLFSVDAAQEFEQRTASRRASALAHHRASEHFSAFMQAAVSAEDRAMRYVLIEGDVTRTVQAACEECGEESPDAVLAAVEQHLAGGAFCDDCRGWKVGPKKQCTCGEAAPEKNDQGMMDDATSAIGDKESKVQWHIASDSTGLADDTSVPFSKKKHDDKVPEKSGEEQDVAKSADYSKDPDLGKMEDVTKLHKEEKGPHTDTWSGKGGQADPVTSHFLSADAVDAALADS